MELFSRAASLLSAVELSGKVDESAEHLLYSLGYLPLTDNSPEQQELRRHRERMLRAGGMLTRFFQLPMQHAPGLTFFGGEVSSNAIGTSASETIVGSVSGSGLTAREALESCVGEAIEFVSQFVQPDDVVAAEASSIVVDAFPTVQQSWTVDAEDGFVAARRLTDGNPVLLPAARCLRGLRPDQLPLFGHSTGCGAGMTMTDATLHGLLELIERDAVALWWRGGVAGRAIATEDDASRAAADFLVAARGAVRGARSTWLLDITTDLGVPCVAALSTNEGGRGLACGAAARPSLAAAAVAAVRDMCHIELAYDVVAAKRRERGDDGLNDADRRHLERAMLDANDCRLLYPAAAPRATGAVLSHATGDAPSLLAALVERLATAGVDLYVVDLTRAAFAIPVARVVAPTLQLEPCQLETSRLRRAAAHEANVGAKQVSIL